MSRSDRNDDPRCKVYIGDLPRDADDRDIEKAFKGYGVIKSVWVARNPPGFAFVFFEDHRDAEDAVKDLDGTVICGERVRVEISNGRSRSRRPGESRGGGGRGPASDEKCYECGRTGHFARDCPRRRGGGGRGGGGRRRSRSRSRGSRDRRRSVSRSMSDSRSRSRS